MAFDQSATAGTTLVQAAIHSPDYAQGSSGWTINRDGSAEFQNVLVRGTITGSTIIGSTITGGTITGGVFVSQSWVSNTAGFAMNGTNSAFTNSGGTIGANSIELNSSVSIGQNSSSNNHVLLARNPAANQSAIEWFSGLASETKPGAILATTSGTQSVLGVQSATINNGAVGAQLWSPTTTQNAQFTIGTASSTAPSGQTTGLMLVGESASDTWQLAISNENSVAGGLHGLTIGNVFSPQSRLFISPNEIKSVDGFGAVEPLYLNQDNGGVVSGGVSALGMRAQGARNTGSATITSTTYAHTLDAPVFVQLPPSGGLIVSHAVTISYPGSSKDFFQDFYINNLTSGVNNVYSPSDNNGVMFNGGTTVIPGPLTGAGAVAGLRLSVTTLANNALGNPGDFLQIGLAQRTSASGSIPVAKAWLVVQPMF